MLIITLISIILAVKLCFKRFSAYLWLISGLICFAWEIYLFTTGGRNYNFNPILELLYHAITEAGPGLIIMILFGHKIKLFDISEYSDDYQEPMKSSESTERQAAGKERKGSIKVKSKIKENLETEIEED
jgi:hypothetical protein